MNRSNFLLSGLLLAPVAIAGGREDLVTGSGLGPIRFGMTVSQFSAALHEEVSEPHEPEDRGCFYLESRRYPGVGFMFEDGKMRRIDVYRGKIATQDGVRIGASVHDVKRRYGAKLSDEPHHYTGPDGRYLTLAISQTIAVRFETEGAKIDNFYVGFKSQVSYVEGCL